MRLQHVHLRLLLHVGGSQVLFGVVVPSEGSALAHEAGPAKDQQQDQEENSTHHPADYGAQAAVGDRGPGGGGEQGFLPAQICVRSGGVVEKGSGGAGGCSGGGRICRTKVRERFKQNSKKSEEFLKKNKKKLMSCFIEPFPKFIHNSVETVGAGISPETVKIC